MHLRLASLILVTVTCLTCVWQVWDTRLGSTSKEPQPLALQSMSLLLPTMNTLNMRVATQSSQFVIVIITASRPGNVSYLPRTLQSLDCALQPAEGSNNSNSNSSLPPVLAVNTEVPASQNAVFEALRQQHEESEPQAGQQPRLLRFQGVGSLHVQLHSPDFVLELAKRSHQGFKVGSGALSCIGTRSYE